MEPPVPQDVIPPHSPESILFGSQPSVPHDSDDHHHHHHRHGSIFSQLSHPHLPATLSTVSLPHLHLPHLPHLPHPHIHMPSFSEDFRNKLRDLHMWLRGHLVFLKRTYYLLSIYYFLIINFLGATAIYLIELDNQDFNLTYLDSLFFSVSASTCTGLNTRNTQALRLGSLFILLLMMTLGSSILLSGVPVVVRRFRLKTMWKREQPTHHDLDAQSHWRVLTILLITLPIFTFGTQVFCFFLLRAAITTTSKGQDALARANVNPWFFAFFISVSSFNNAGFSPLSDNLMSFNRGPFFLMVCAFLILAGNTAYPPLLRFILSRAQKWLGPAYQLAIHKLLKDPRQYYTHLFDPLQTHWLMFVLLAINGGEFVLLCILDWHIVGSDGSTGIETFFSSVFQTISVRNAGFNSVDLTKLKTATQWIYVIMMYVSVYPVAISIRSTVKDDQTKDTTSEKLRYMMTRDLSIVIIAIFAVAWAESSRFADPNFNMFKVIFEVVTAFGNVGLSLGNLDDGTTSFSGALSDFGKLVIMITMLAGKHRGLPHLSDMTIQLRDDDAVRAESGEVLREVSIHPIEEIRLTPRANARSLAGPEDKGL